MPDKTTFFKLDRKIFESDIWLQPVELRIFVYLIGQARFEEKPYKKYKSKGVIIRKGQYLRSYRKLQKDLEYIENNAIKHYSLSRIKRAVDNLEKQNRIKTKITELGTLFTVVNYCHYQGWYEKNNEHRTQLEQQRNADGTQMEQQRNNTNKVNKDNNDNKRKKEKLNFENFFEKNVDKFEPFLQDMSKGVVLNACKISVKKDKPMAYCNAVLKDWRKKGIEKLDDLKQATENNNIECDYKWKGFFVKDWDRFKE